MLSRFRAQKFPERALARYLNAVRVNEEMTEHVKPELNIPLTTNAFAEHDAQSDHFGRKSSVGPTHLDGGLSSAPFSLPVSGPHRKGSDAFVRALENEGVTYIFGVPGEENLDFLESLRNSSITLVVTRHEQVAGFMAALTEGLLANQEFV